MYYHLIPLLISLIRYSLDLFWTIDMFIYIVYSFIPYDKPMSYAYTMAIVGFVDHLLFVPHSIHHFLQPQSNLVETCDNKLDIHISGITDIQSIRYWFLLCHE